MTPGTTTMAPNRSVIMIRRLLPAVATALALLLTGCTSADAGDTTPGSATPLAPITVETRDLQPTVSMDATVVAGAEFVVVALAAGVVADLPAEGTNLAAGKPVVTVGGHSVNTPVDGVVTKTLADVGQKVPANYPLAAIRYSGFALAGPIQAWAQPMLLGPKVTARGQVSDSPPFDCAALAPQADATADSSGVPWLCLLPKNALAANGQGGIVVAVGLLASQVVAVPLSAVAGRQGTGQVTLITPAGNHVVDVSLGPSDGTYVQITSGLKAGDQISPTPPDLDVTSPG